MGADGYVARISRSSPLALGDKLIMLNNRAVASGEDVISLLRQTPPDAEVPITVQRNGQQANLNVACENARPYNETTLAALDQAAAGKFDECVATVAKDETLGHAAAGIRLGCASLSRNAKNYDVGTLAYNFLRMTIEDAYWSPATRAQALERLRSSEGAINQSLGTAKFQELVSLTQKWPNGERAFDATEPKWEVMRRNAESALRARLIDPDSGRFEWPHGFLYGAWQPPFQKRIDGYWTCGRVNARNRMGGYTGATSFVAVVDANGSVKFVDMGSGKDFDILSSQCDKSVRLLPPPQVGSSAPLVASSPTSIADELSKLAQLRDSGVLSQSEFEAAKAKLLGRAP